MCGIAGFSVAAHRDKYSMEAELHRMTGMIFHRGPNAEGIYVDERIALGSRRLSLVDVESGSQPFYNEDRSIVVVYNGEIYNYMGLRKFLVSKGHKLTTHCDGEIISHLYEEYGLDFLTYLDGMFAIALWDGRRNKLILSIDQIGIKPLYYTVRENQIVFASELKAVTMSERPQIDPLSIMKYLKYKYIPAPDTPYQGIKKLKPGQVIIWENHSLRYDSRQQNVISENPDLTELLSTNIMSTTMSDKKVGCLLSGGLDSSIVTSVMAEHASDTPVFSVGYPGNLEADETEYSRKLCHELGVDYHLTHVAPQEIPTALHQVVWHLDEPNQDPIIIPYYLLLKDVKDYVPVVLTGDGADEFFGGYQRFSIWDNNLGDNPFKYSNQLFLFRLNELNSDFVHEYTNEFMLQPSEQDFSQINSLRECMEWERAYRLPAYHLNRVDKLSMAWGVEARVPFLRPEITSYALKLKNTDLRSKNIEKVKLKSAFKESLPDWLVHREKKPFTFPISHWLRNELKEWSWDTLRSSESDIHSYIDHSYIEQLLEEHGANRADHGNKIWSLLVLDTYLKQA